MNHKDLKELSELEEQKNLKQKNEEYNEKEKRKPSREKGIYGICYALLYAAFMAFVNIIIKQTYLLSSTEQVSVRYFLQLLVSAIIAWNKKIKISDHRDEYCLLASRAI